MKQLEMPLQYPCPYCPQSRRSEFELTCHLVECAGYGEKLLLDHLQIAWTGHPCDYSFRLLAGQNFGEVPYSELACYTRAAGHKILAYALWVRNMTELLIQRPEERLHLENISWAHVLYQDERGKRYVLDGLPCEVLSEELRQQPVPILEV